ncbi:MAG: BRCT domain-containing protein [Fusobacteriaceae bacterium]
MKILEILKEGYTQLSNDDTTFVTEGFKDIMTVTYSKLIEYYKGDKSLEQDFSREELNEVTELAIKIANSIYTNFGEIGEVVDDGFYDELVYIYKHKTGNLLFGAPNRKKNVDVKHMYPQLKGTLEKIRYIYKDEAEAAGKSRDSLEEFVERYFDTSYSQNGTKITCAISLKYDGISAVVDMIDGEIAQVLTRGDNQMGADITKLFKGYKFPNLNTEFMESSRFGIQCEAVFKKDKLDEFNMLSGKEYKNARSAMVGLASSFENNIKCSDFISLIPISLSEKPICADNRCGEFRIINDCLEPITEWVYISGYTVYDILERFSIYKDLFLSDRDSYPYMVDGLVIEFSDYMVRAELGRERDINKFAIAYKFPSQNKLTEVTDVTFSVGRTGEIIPKVHYKPVYFNGGEFRKSTLSNVTNFKLMDLKPGDVINVQYSNDVLCYVHKDHMHPTNLHNPNVPYDVPRACPHCDGRLSLLQKDGLKLYCTNEECPSRLVEGMVNFINKLNIRDIGLETVQYLYDSGLVKNIVELVNLDVNVLTGRSGFGPKKIAILENALDNIVNNNYKDYEVLGALGIKNASITTFQPVCKRFDFEYYMNDGFIPGVFELQLAGMKGFGPKKSSGMFYELNRIFKDPKFIALFKSMNIEFTYSDSVEDELMRGPRVCFSGVRDSVLEGHITRYGGFIVNSVNKETDILVVRDASTKSTKVDKANKYGIEVVSYGVFKGSYVDILADHDKKYS